MELFKIFGTIGIKNKEANDALDETTGKASSSSDKISESFKKVGAAIATYFTVQKLVEFGTACVNAASDVQEMQNKFDVVFQGMTAEVEAWAESFASAIGRNSNTIKGYLADNQNMFVGMGMTRDASAELSEKLVSLALDLASFNNLNETVAVNAMSKALMGETESAKSLGAVLNENTIAEAQLQLGYEGKFQNLTEAQKMEVRYQAILNQSADAIGDCERSLDSYKGQTIQLNSAKEKLMETIGSLLLPVMTKLVGGANNVVSVFVKMAEFFKEHQELIQYVAIAFGTLASAIGLYTIAQNAATLATTLATAASATFGAVMAFLTSPITLIIVAIGALVAALLWVCNNFELVQATVDEWGKFIQEKINKMVDVVVQKISSFVGSVKSKFNDIKSTATSIFNSVHDTVVGIWDKIKNGIVDKITAAKDAVKTAIDAIKNLMNFTFQLPHLPLPHFSISPSGWKVGDLLKGSIPKLGVEWYAKGGILEDPTIFGINGNKAMVGGESGPEAIAPIDKLQEYVSESVATQNQGVVEALNRILDAIVDLDENMGGNMREALDGTALKINQREFGRLVRGVV